MRYFVDSYERNKKYLVAFAVLAFCITVIYIKRLVDFPKIGVALFVVLAFFIFLWWSVLCIHYTRFEYAR